MTTYPRNGPTDARLYPLDGQTTPTMTADDIRPKVCRPNRPILFPTDRTAKSISPTHCRRWQPTSDFHKVPDQPMMFLSHHSTTKYRHIVGQPVQTPYNRYRLLSCQGHAVRPPWGIVPSRTRVNSDDLTTHNDLITSDDLTTPQLSAPLMAGPYRILL